MLVSVQSSSFKREAAQADGRCWISEIITLSNGLVLPSTYLAAADYDAASRLTITAQQVLDGLAAREIAANIGAVLANGSLANPTFIYSTTANNLAALRAAYTDASRTDAVMIGDYLGTLTDTQLGNIFNMTQAQVTTLRTNKLTPAASLASSIRAAAGQ